MPGTEETGYQGKNILVVGAARSGVAAAEFLLARAARVTLTDVKELQALSPAVESLRALACETGNLILELGGHRPESFRSCDLVVVSPGVPLALEIFDESRNAGVPIVSEVELAARHLKGRIIGITGSNGKTTTTTLAAGLLRGAGLRAYAAGNIGKPLISLCAQSTPEDLYVTELSSFQLEAIDRLRPFVAAVLNLTPDHLDRYAGFEEYIAAKKRIFKNQTHMDFAVLNADDPRTAALSLEVPSRAVLFSRCREPEHGAFVRKGRVLYRDCGGERELFETGAISLVGEHNLENVLAACAVAILAGAPAHSLNDVIRSFKGVEHRLERVAEVEGVLYFNDSKATNVDAAIKSLRSFPGRIHLIAGGRDKGGEFAVLRPLVRERVKHLVLVGEAAGKIRAALGGLVETSEAASLPEAVFLCRRKAVPGDVVLLAPACASFDMFENYEHRGRVFKQAVHRLEEKTAHP